MAPHSSTLAWKIPWAEEPGRLQCMGSQRVRHNWATSLSLSCTGEGNGNPLQCSCLENPRDVGAWWAAVYGVTQSQDWSDLAAAAALLGRKLMTNLDSILKSRDITLLTKVRLVKAVVFSSGHVWMWELEYEESWVPKNWCFWNVLLEKRVLRLSWTWESLELQGDPPSPS